MSEYLEKKYASKVKIVELRKPQREWYKVRIICEFEDESEMHDTIELEDLLDDELYYAIFLIGMINLYKLIRKMKMKQCRVIK